jgi:hypothetical protein
MKTYRTLGGAEEPKFGKYRVRQIVHNCEPASINPGAPASKTNACRHSRHQWGRRRVAARKCAETYTKLAPTFRGQAVAAGPSEADVIRFSGTVNSAKLQSEQTTSSGKTQTWGRSMFFGPRKWIAISPVNLPAFSEPHDLHGIAIPLPTIRTGSSPFELGRNALEL